MKIVENEVSVEYRPRGRRHFLGKRSYRRGQGSRSRSWKEVVGGVRSRGHRGGSLEIPIRQTRRDPLPSPGFDSSESFNTNRLRLNRKLIYVVVGVVENDPEPFSLSDVRLRDRGNGRMEL